VLVIFGQVAIWQGDYSRARPLLEESLTLDESLGWIANTDSLSSFGYLYLRMGDYQEARSCFEKSLSSSQQTGERFVRHWSLVHLGYVFLRMGEFAQAQKIFVQSLQHFKEFGHETGIIYTLEGFASMAASLGQAEQAARLFAWADTARKTNRDTRPPVEQADVDRDIVAILEMIDGETYAATYADGQTMTREQAIACGLELEVS
jgi:tetratricopeptide (TPR) repeat protein